MNTKTVEYVSLLDDLMFKFLFGYQKNIRFTEYLLELLFNFKPDSLKNKIKIMNSIKLDNTSINQRGFEADVIVKMPDGKIINLEAYTDFRFSSKIKSFMYLSYLFSTNLQKGEKVSIVKPHLQINFIKDKNIPSRNYVIISDDQAKEYFINDYFEIKVINIANYEINNYNIDERLKRLFKLLNATTNEEAKEAVKGDKKLKEMYDEAYEFMKDEFRKNYFSWERYLESVQEEKLEERELKGRLEGRLEGQQETKKKITKNLLKQNVSVDIIERTGLSKDEKLEIQKEINNQE